jgi:DNA helicase HerA-like ATPase
LGLLQIYEIPKSHDFSQRQYSNNMQNVISSLRDGSHTLVYALSSRDQEVKLMTGVRRFQKNKRYQTDHYTGILCRSLCSNFPGITLFDERKASGSDLPYRMIPEVEYQRDIIEQIKDGYLASITGIPSLRDLDFPNDMIGQGIDRLVDALRGEKYLLLILAEPICDDRLVEMVTQLRELSGEVHTLVSESRSISRNRSTSETKAEFNNKTISVGAGQILSAIFGISASYTKGSSYTLGTAEGMGASVTQETLDKTAQFCEQVLEHYINRSQIGRNIGFWKVGAFLASDNFNTYMRAQGIIRSLYSGVNTHAEPLRVIDMSSAPPIEPGKPGIRQSLANLEVPVLNHLGANTNHPLGSEYQSLGTPLTTNELSILFSFPNREVPGLKLKQVADFNLNPPPPAERSAEIGSLLYRGEKLPARFAIGAKSLLRHTFITGLTGSGKTNTCLALLEDAYLKRGLNFLVIDPAKTEYRFLLASNTLGRKLSIFTLGEESLSPFRLNPFEFVPGYPSRPKSFPLLTHIDLLKAVFNAAFPMYASMPYLLEEALLKIYQERGWNIADSTNRYFDVLDIEIDYAPYLPRLSDLYNKIDDVVASKRYDVRVTLDLTAALKARLGSLLNGNKGLMLDTCRSISFQKLLKQPVILELQHIGDEDEKAFIMALIFISLYEATFRRPIDNQLQHVTLIEEAHRLLRNIPVSIAVESANPRGKTVEMFTDMMAEMRARGEAFMIVDQMPSKLVPDIIKGSDLKIVHRLLAHDDRQAVGNAMGLSLEQIDFLPRLKVGQAVIHSEQLEEACLVKIDPKEDELISKHEGSNAFEKNANIEKKMSFQMADFRETSGDYFRRFPACGYMAYSKCEAPCEFKPLTNEPSKITLDAASDYISALIVGNYKIVVGSGSRLRSVVENRLNTQFPNGFQHGHRHCALIQLSNQAVQRLIHAHPHADNWKSALVLQCELINLWEQLWSKQIPNGTELKELNQLIIKQIATSPSQSRPGCRRCPARCLFGHRFQVDGYPTARALSEELHASRPNTVDIEKISDWAVQAVGANLRPNLYKVAGYCLLSQATLNEGLLSNYREQAFNNIR